MLCQPKVSPDLAEWPTAAEIAAARTGVTPYWPSYTERIVSCGWVLRYV